MLNQIKQSFTNVGNKNTYLVFKEDNTKQEKTHWTDVVECIQDIILFQVLPFSTLNETVCRCPPAAGKFFATSFLTPNLIDFHNVFAKFDASNAAVYGTMIGLFLIYVGLFIYLRRKDKTDIFKVSKT